MNTMKYAYFAEDEDLACGITLTEEELADIELTEEFSGRSDLPDDVESARGIALNFKKLTVFRQRLDFVPGCD